MITHEYQMAQIIKALWHVARESADLAYLKSVVQNEPDGPAKDALRIVLGMCGNSSVECDLLRIAGGRDQPHVRALAIHGLRETGAVGMIPDIMDFLKDPQGIEVPNYRYRDGRVGRGTDFPVRRAAFVALRTFGVDVEKANEADYRVNAKSAVSVLEERSRIASDEGVAEILKAIRRVGGEAAQQALKAFIEANEARQSKTDLVSGARALLAEVEAEL